MLSICIPVYNFEVVELCSDLDRQARALGISFEILCTDDASDAEYRNINRRLHQIDSVKYKELDSNVGRSAIRNLLADEASFPHIIFMDCDSRVESEEYLSNFIEVKDQAKVIYGGRSYEKTSPNKEHLLRWKYGVERESTKAYERNKNPYGQFMTNNFMIDRELILEFRFNEDLVGYGHEDTLFAIDLAARNVDILHIDNPLCHIGLETADVYLKKTEEGVRNLARIIKMGKLGNRNKLYRSYLKLKRFGLVGVYKSYAKRNKHKMLNNLKSDQPNLRNFDLLKLYYLSIYL